MNFVVELGCVNSVRVDACNSTWTVVTVKPEDLANLIAALQRAQDLEIQRIAAAAV